MSHLDFINQQPFVVDAEDLAAPWGGYRDGSRFRCHLCGHRFALGDICRWVHAMGKSFTDDKGKKWGVINFFTCAACDGLDVLDRWIKANEDYSIKYWWAKHDD